MANIAFLLWSADISGGTNVIFEHSKRLGRYGHNVTIITESKVTEEDLAWHPGANTLNWVTYEEVTDEEFELVFATWWKTALKLHEVNAKHYAYFVQSIESRFYPEEEVPLRQLVDMTYLLPVKFVTEANWIKAHLHQYYAQDAELVLNGINKKLYTGVIKSKASVNKGKLRVLVEGPLGVPFKNVERSIELCKQSNADEVWLLTLSDVSQYEGVDRIYSRIDVTKTPEIYASCDVLVKLSKVEGMFGPPLEMFHCGGTAVTYNVSGYDEYIVDGENALVADMDDEEAVVSFINELKADVQKLTLLKEKAIQTAENWPDWEQSSRMFSEAVERMLEGEINDRAKIEALNKTAWAHYEYSEQLRLSTEDGAVKISLAYEERIKDFQSAMDSQTRLIDERDAYIRILEDKINNG